MPDQDDDSLDALTDGWRLRLDATRQRLAQLARTVADIEDELAWTFTRMADQFPHRAKTLVIHAESARAHAVVERERADAYNGDR